ncbi:hypothetical protein [Paenibacillus sp. UMB4589-SE434]|uniref:hypothetical protein n=1 Tax=Paenibacillus sp. UMB4589-SE434 TaxID=3046314 RepID=UPI0025501FB9|nr:hypothetical protein [Paenibacillus sp. UMB4589-SE434]MDK8182073.1 hypothetical protein [Paenibacillus sp. UMB4589-SE434]
MIIKAGTWQALTDGERESAIALMVDKTAKWHERMVQRAIKEYMPVYNRLLDAENAVEANQYRAQLRQLERKYGIPAVVA